MSLSSSDLCVGCQLCEAPLKTLAKYAWYLVMVTLYFSCQPLTCPVSSNSSEHPCPDFASYVFICATAIWLGGMNLVPACLDFSAKYITIYKMIIIPVLSSVIHKLVWVELIKFLHTMEFIFYELVVGDGFDISYTSILDPTAMISLNDVLAVGALLWVLTSYSIIQCFIAIVKKLLSEELEGVCLCTMNNDSQQSARKSSICH